jgi:hypothetical protein
MAIGSVQVAETSLENRLAAQKELVARIISEGKDATEANAQLYELSKALAELSTKVSTRLPALDPSAYQASTTVNLVPAYEEK